MPCYRIVVKRLGAHFDLRRSVEGPWIMGVVNVTPDSFSDGGRHEKMSDVYEHIDALLEEGAHVIDIGGESTRPGALPVCAAEQLERVMPAVRHAVANNATVSVDTTLPAVAQAALDAGALMINDVSCLRDGNELAALAAKYSAGLVLMHARVPMSQMPGFSQGADDAYEDIMRDVMREWSVAAQKALLAGLDPSLLFFDPGIGFNKNARQSNEIIRRLGEAKSLGHRIVMGTSRKSFLCADVSAPPTRRLGGTVASCIASVKNGAWMLRVHDVLEVRQALAVAQTVGLLDNLTSEVGSHV
jgi:dihydropteroate synthase